MRRLILHHNDADGKCAAAIAARWMNELKEIDVHCERVNYGEEPPWGLLEKLGPDDPVWIVDFSYEPEQMLEIARKYGHRLYWFDHHGTSIDKLQAIMDPFGIEGRRQVGIAGCMLVWQFCHRSRRPPLAVEYIADRDLWKFAHGDRTRWFYEKYLLEQATHPLAKVWDTWFEMTEWQYENYLRSGEELHRARRGMLQGIARRIGYECNLLYLPGDFSPLQPPGKPDEKVPAKQLKVLKVNFPGSGDMGEVIREMGYDLAWVYCEEYRNGKMGRVNSLYSEKVDVGEIAKGHGGGGHKGAAGFVEVI